MKHRILSLAMLTALLCMLSPLGAMAQRPDTIWYRHDNRFTPHRVFPIAEYDTITFKSSMMVLTKPNGASGRKSIGYITTAPGEFVLTNPGRILYQPSSMGGDFSLASNRWCFQRSRESEHFVCFWEQGANIDVDYMLRVAERTWDVYTKRLGFVREGNSSTDTYKIVIRAYNTADWVASGSGEDMKVGTFNISPNAITARGGHTVAHEIGHTFQYLTNVDCGANNVHGFNYGLGDNGWGGNGFWEDCANWMAYKVYPERQFTDGEYLEGYLNNCHLNIMHEAARYTNCFYQDYLCQRYGQDFIGRLWREAERPEDPVDAIKRLQSLSHDEFSALMYDCFAHMCTWDIDEVRQAAQHRVGAHLCRLHARDIDGEEWFQVDSAFCPQNYGYNITRLKVPAAGTEIGVDFQGLTSEPGYRHLSTAQAGWRWGLVAQLTDGSTLYAPMQTQRQGHATWTVPQDCQSLWLVVMGAPARWWHHAWDDDAQNDEQWPYRVRFTATRPTDIPHTYTAADFPEDYQRRDTTVVIHANLPASTSAYSSVRVQYDMDAISEALGLTTQQLHAIRVGGTLNPRFVGMSPSGSLTNNTTTSTSSATCLGHWFTTAGTVCGYDGTAAIFAEMYTDSYGCYVGQYPGRLRAGKEYVVRQAILYKQGTRTYRAVMEVHLHVI